MPTNEGHTSGPWTWDMEKGVTSCVGGRTVRLADTFAPYERGELPPEECAANSALFAIAPELLWCVQQYLKECGDGYGGGIDLESTGRLMAINDRARKALEGTC